MKTETKALAAPKLKNSPFITNAIQRIFLTRGLKVHEEEIPSEIQLKIFDRARLELIVEQRKLLDIGYGLYMISINYNQYTREHTIEEVKNYFDKFYHQWLVPELLGNHATRVSKRHLWPIVTLNTEETSAHRSGPIHNQRVKSGRNKPIYHQHAAVAVHPSLIDHFNRYVGINKIDRNNDTNMIESIDIRKADEFGMLYCLKNYNEEVFSKRYGPFIKDELIKEKEHLSRNEQLINLLSNTSLKIENTHTNHEETIH